MAEVMLSLGIFALLSSFSFSIMLSSLRMERSNDVLNMYLAYLEALKEVMTYNFSYNEISSLKNDNRLYINIEGMDYECFRDERIKQQFAKMPAGDNYIALNIQGGNVLKVSMVLHIIFNGQEEIYETEFYKGFYQRGG